MGDQGGRILSVDAETMTVEAEAGTFQADMINIIPPLKAAKIAFDQGLVDESGWCPVDQKTFESTRHADVHVIGDSCIAGAMPKSGYAANSQAKVLAIQLRALLAGNPPVEPVFQNTCYALAGNTESGMFVADVFRLEDGTIVRVDEQRYLPFEATKLQKKLAAVYQHNWMQAFSDDCFA
jgi:sulfide dehydrogenase [flavocytochrome c] flavoprotein subunit